MKQIDRKYTFEHLLDDNGERQAFGHQYGEEGAEERGVIEDLTSRRSGSVPPFIRGDACNEDCHENLYLSSDYNPVVVPRAIARLNKNSAKAHQRTPRTPADGDLVANLIHKITRLKTQRDDAESSDVSSSMFAGLRGGAGDDNGDQFRARHSENSNNAQDTETSELLELEQEIERLNLLMAKAQKLPQGDQTNSDILAQLQRMINQLEAERDAAQNAKTGSETDQLGSWSDKRGAKPNLRGGAEEEQHMTLHKRFDRLALAFDWDLADHPAPRIPPRNPARMMAKQRAVGSVPASSDSRSKGDPELIEPIAKVQKLDRSICCLESLILAQAENPRLNVKHASYGTLALVRKLESLVDVRAKLYDKALLLADRKDAASSPAPSTLTNASASHTASPHTTEARLSGGGDAPYRILDCQDWTWKQPNWLFDNRSPLEKIHLMRERYYWLRRQKPIDHELAEIDRDLERLEE
ncbi:hypothetical protein E8E12_010216 [Didymella heteroderae]|uniref:Uncharacterized protein n=1 Tax=Didymella heteroderae TaxID=1769908 RepID=A0A9P5C542_9PLEO|nr:hypothetical protein E8E12_010216 [Didymella heteroderae]